MRVGTGVDSSRFARIELLLVYAQANPACLRADVEARSSRGVMII
jgi:hypothetical protein